MEQGQQCCKLYEKDNCDFTDTTTLRECCKKYESQVNKEAEEQKKEKEKKPEENKETRPRLVRPGIRVHAKAQRRKGKNDGNV